MTRLRDGTDERVERQQRIDHDDAAADGEHRGSGRRGVEVVSPERRSHIVEVTRASSPIRSLTDLRISRSWWVIEHSRPWRHHSPATAPKNRHVAPPARDPSTRPEA